MAVITEIFLAALAFGFLIPCRVQMTDPNGREGSFQSANWCLGLKENWYVVGKKRCFFSGCEEQTDFCSTICESKIFSELLYANRSFCQ